MEFAIVCVDRLQITPCWSREAVLKWSTCATNSVLEQGGSVEVIDLRH